jgi:hypothetical protein
MNTTFEINPNAPLIEGTNNLADSLHEALCLAIHENDPEALKWLGENVIDIK